MLYLRLLIRKIPNNIAKIFFPVLFTFIFLSPLIYYWSLLFFSGISSNYNSYFIVEKEGRVSFQKKKPSSWITIREAPSSVVWPIIVSEDWDFYNHSGVDWQQLKIVLIDGIKNLSVKRGASTITQQVIKNLFLNDERSYFRKFNEIILAYYLESKVSKKWILEQYLNLAEFDNNVYGVKKASYHFFKKAPYQLRFKEGAFLAMLLPSPKKYSVSYYKKDLTHFARKQVARILGKLVIAKVITRETMLEEISKPFSWENTSESMGMNVLELIIDKIKSGEDFDEVETVEEQQPVITEESSPDISTKTPEIVEEDKPNQETSLDEVTEELSEEVIQDNN